MHRFCIPCMKTWMQLRNTCPLCNAKLVYLIVGVTPSGSFSTIPIVNDPQTRMEAEEAVRAGTAVDFIWTGNQRFAPRYLTLGGHTVRALSPTHPEPTTDEDDDDLDDGEAGGGKDPGGGGGGRNGRAGEERAGRGGGRNLIAPPVVSCSRLRPARPPPDAPRPPTQRHRRAPRDGRGV
uniref:RL2-1 n=1 Tax=Human herpesvirus 1 TaxID=10298 RepID=A0A2Z4H348_HHV1|nr:RL2-1 [Human alphaherpesvirus 1]AWW11840.1 RL2-1 [Human alphaherpesvirus 1]AWW12425.1 RL2-3 [Human alphaherpesvirus 1]